MREEADMAQITNTSSPRKGETSSLWLIKILTGPLLIIILIIHMIVNHLLPKNGLMSYNDVVIYFRNPLVVGMEIVLLATVVTHSLLGVRSVILDMNPSRTLLKFLDWLFGLAGVGAVVYGIWLALTIASHGI
jgi:succinate dehydrogenase / fumarate reductase membrane anchor subunit